MDTLVFTTDRGKWHQNAAREAAPEGIKVIILRKPGKDELKKALNTAEFLISERSGVIDQQLLESAKKLKLIQRLGSLIHDIDLEQAQKQGIAVCYLPIPGVIRVAEHLILQILALTKKIQEVEEIALEASSEWGDSQQTDEDTFSYNWSGRAGIGQIWEKTLGIIGFGEIGVELARRLNGWGCDVLYHKRAQLPERIEQELGIRYQDPETLLKESDIVVNLLPYLPATVNYFDRTRIEGIKKGAILVSCGSGGTIDEDALAQAVITGHLSGAAMDSFAAEPLQEENPLVLAARTGKNIFLTPHTAGGTEDDLPPDKTERSRDYINILHYQNNEPLEYQVI